MPSPARQFEPHITRSGGAPSSYRFTVRCSECPKTDSYEANHSVRDDVVKGHFKGRGWLLGRGRSYDLCPACLARPRNTEQRQVPETARHRFGMKARHPDREAAPLNARHKDTADILARHLGKPKALAAEVFRPKEAQPPRPAIPDAARQPVSAPALPPEVEQALTGMAADLKSLRSAMELVAEQMSKLVVLGGEQIEAIARLAPLMIQSTEGISGSFREVVTAVQAISDESAVPAAQQPRQEISSEPAPEQVEPAVSTKRIRGPRKTESKVGKVASGQVVVKSIPDAKRADRFYTTIRLPRALWDHSGFGPEDRIQMDLTPKSLSIRRVSDGGVKPKTIGDVVVVLQSWRLGNLNFDHARIVSGETSLRLMLQ